MFCVMACGVLSSLVIILLKKRELLYLNCAVTVSVLCLYLIVPWLSLMFVIVEFPCHTPLRLHVKIKLNEIRVRRSSTFAISTLAFCRRMDFYGSILVQFKVYVHGFKHFT